MMVTTYVFTDGLQCMFSGSYVEKLSLNYPFHPFLSGALLALSELQLTEQKLQYV